jgi:hypothetical protein
MVTHIALDGLSVLLHGEFWAKMEEKEKKPAEGGKGL